MKDNSDKVDYIHDYRIKIGQFDGTLEYDLVKQYVPFWSNLKHYLTSESGWDSGYWTRVKKNEWSEDFDRYVSKLMKWCKEQGMTEDYIKMDYDITNKMYTWYWYPPHDHCTKRELRWYGLKDNQVVLLENTSD